ncbi:MAG: YeeE/YedE family protein [Proteobacteria bacterium]|nr:YeeE/YedE family protein [Pseudomonadota bacterium]MBT7110911.1 YeeE/YedE family protein [Pseudomonadota bacterium]
MEFTLIKPLFGGFLLGLAALSLLFFNGRVAGVSGILGGFLSFRKRDTLWRFAFLTGLVAGGVLLLATCPETLDLNLKSSPPAVMLAGLLVGIGSRMGSGCTSGHGICGIGRLSQRSMIAAVIFLSSGIAAAVLIDLVFGGVI